MSSNKTQKDSKRKLVLLDAHAIIHRAYHALPDFHNSKGEPTGALYGIVAMLVNIIKDIKPDYIAACYDLPKPTFRHEVFKDYKGGRKKADDALIEQIKRSKDIFDAFNIPVYEKEGFEADDVLGTIAKQVEQNKDLQVVIASGDMDTLQLVKGKKVRVYTMKKGLKDTIIYDEKAVKDRFGFAPKLLTDYKGLRGDPSDNIPGIKGIGEKTATALITKLGDLDKIYTALEGGKGSKKLDELKLTPRIKKLLLDGKEEAYFSKMLATIKSDVDIEYKLPAKRWLGSVDTDKALNLLQTFELRTLVPRVRELLGVEVQDIVKTDFTDEDVQKLGIMLWLIKSDITNPTLDDILQFAGTRDFTQAKSVIEQILKDRHLDNLYSKIEEPLIPIIKQINETGVLLDTEYFRKLSDEYHKELLKIENKIYKLAGMEFNIRSPKQLGEVLFEKIGLKTRKKTSTGQYSTNEKELKKLKDEHEIIPMIFEYRELQKLLSTYIDNMPKMVDEFGRLHTKFLQAGTTTGRLASVNPNMQNIPTRTELGRAVRRGFIAPANSKLVSFDYSQIELRCAAELSGDTKLINIFKNGGDIHTEVAAKVFNVEPSSVKPEMRRRAKIINFGILYGMGVNALRDSLQEGSEQKVELSEAREYLNKYFATFKGLADWIDRTKSEALRLGYTETIFGRRRYFEGLNSPLPYIRASAERMAVNAPVQGTSADITKLAMINVHKFLSKKGLLKKVKMVLQVHDELIFEIDNSTMHDTDILQQIKKRMEDVAKLKVPIIVDIKLGENWADMEKLK